MSSGGPGGEEGRRGACGAYGVGMAVVEPIVHGSGQGRGHGGARTRECTSEGGSGWLSEGPPAQPPTHPPLVLVPPPGLLLRVCTAVHHVGST